jgi:hypothetical protein
MTRPADRGEIGERGSELPRPCMQNYRMTLLNESLCRGAAEPVGAACDENTSHDILFRGRITHRCSAIHSPYPGFL